MVQNSVTFFMDGPLVVGYRLIQVERVRMSLKYLQSDANIPIYRPSSFPRGSACYVAIMLVKV